MGPIEHFGPDANGRRVSVTRNPSIRIGAPGAYTVSLREPGRAEDWYAADAMDAHLRARRAYHEGQAIRPTT